jgi:Flp pilus assembly protein TadD
VALNTSANIAPAARADAAILDRRDGMLLAAILLLTAIVFSNGLTGEFVLDDQKQIVRNDLIRYPSFWGAALTHDIWAFQGERDQPWSNYWRPGHVLWLIANYQVFKAHTWGWHLTSILAHMGVIASAYVMLRLLGASLGVAGAIAALFAVHPTRCESVTWIAGVHDVLSSLGQLLALLCLMSIWRLPKHRRKTRSDHFALIWRWSAAIVLYALAVGTKEIAVFFGIIVAVVRYTDPAAATLKPADRWKTVWLSAAPFLSIAALFLLLRRLVLGAAQLPFPWQPSYTAVLATLPLVACFYLRQMLFPFWVGWSYPIRAVSSAANKLWTFWLPLIVLTLLVWLATFIVRSRLQIIGAAILVLSLFPALNLRAFIPEQIVKDRYLYLPLLGFLMIIVPAAAQLLARLPNVQTRRRVGWAATALLVLFLSAKTFQYNFAWRSELSVWEWAVRSDPRSATNMAGLGVAQMLAGRLEDARLTLDRSLDTHVTSDALSARAELALNQQRFADAAIDCQSLLQMQPDNFRAYERLAIALERQGRLAEAADVYRTAREKVPHRRAFFTDQLAIVLVRQNLRQEALTELESAKERALTDYTPASRLVIFHLGILYGEMGRKTEAYATLRQFMELTDGSSDPSITAARATAQRHLSRAQ